MYVYMYVYKYIYLHLSLCTAHLLEIRQHVVKEVEMRLHVGVEDDHDIVLRRDLFVRGRTIQFICSADGSIHTVSNKLYRKVKHRAYPNLSSRQRPKRALIRRRSRRRQRRGEPHTEHGFGVWTYC